ncbi:MAG TPA: GIY-YIG nuclease family protein [Longimicrobium sp.]|nr:GIY-YIG nuclease family protein [Longimicrobium sp.]
MVRLIDLLALKGIALNDYKIHFATTSGDSSPLQAYFEGWFQIWQEQQNQRNFGRPQVLSLIALQPGIWLFGGVFRVLGVSAGTVTPFRYSTELLPGQEDLIGRVVVGFAKNFRASYVMGERYGPLLEVVEISRERVSIEPFPGFGRVVLPHPRLRVIVQRQEPSWRAALSSVKGVYVIADTRGGQLYVGSATGTAGLWQRWSDYALTGHGGNKELIALASNDASYVDAFQYSILEIATLHTPDDVILQREQHWKSALLAREIGLNWN